jgi:hypothetical protein
MDLAPSGSRKPGCISTVASFVDLLKAATRWSEALALDPDSGEMLATEMVLSGWKILGFHRSGSVA